MSRLQSAEAKYYLGSVSHSMEHLPKWYQIFAISGIIFVIYLRDNPIISWLVVNLHSSFGTGFIWYGEYQQLLEQMSFNERLCFTLYGVALGAAVAVLYKLLSREAHGLGWSATQLFPDRKGASFAMFAFFCVIEMVRMRSVIAECLGEKGSLANLAVKGFVGLEDSGYDPRLTSSNQHFIVQLEVLKAVAKNVLFVRTPVLVASGVFRAFRDIPRRTHAALRWYLATGSVFMLLREVLFMYVNQTYDDPAPWGSLLWTVVLLGTINYLYGPSKRAGMVVTATTANSFAEALRAATTCIALWCTASLLVLTVSVSVHVVELMSLWLILSLLIVWLPAIIDSCSTDYVTLLSGSVAWLANAMGYVTVRGSVRLGVLFASWWFATCLVYNVATNVTLNRNAGIAVVLAFFFWGLSQTMEPSADVAEKVRHAAAATLQVVEETAASKLSQLSSQSIIDGNGDSGEAEGGESGIFSAAAFQQRQQVMNQQAAEQVAGVANFLDERLLWLCHLSDYDAELRKTPEHHPRHVLTLGASAETRPLLGEAKGRAHVDREHFASALETAVLLCAVLILVNHFNARRISSDRKLWMRRRNVVLASPAVLCRKAVRTLVLVFCVICFLLSALTFRRYVLPHIIRFLPDFMSQGISVGIGCVVLGALMDTKESMYDSVARVIGLADPPAINDDGSPVVASPDSRVGMQPDDDLDEDFEVPND